MDAPPAKAVAAAAPCMGELSIIIPVLDEAGGIAAALASLQVWRAHGHEVIVVDGGSADDTVAQARPYADQVLRAPRGRAAQMNAGAARSRGHLLLFLHADTLLPASALAELESVARDEHARWGRFEVRLSGRSSLLRIVAVAMNLRSRLTGIATGDQAIFVKRAVFEAVGGYPALALMEDIALSSRLKRIARPRCLAGPALTSARRWEQQGLLRTIFTMWMLRGLFFCGVDTAALARRYRPVREEG